MRQPDGPPVAAALANWNGGAFLQRCLDALRGQSHSLQQIVVVDNGSSDGSTDWLAQQRDVKLLRLSSNQGYCRGYNAAIDATDAAFVLVLNTDVYLERDFVASALSVLGQDEGLAAVTGHFYEEATQLDIGGGFDLRRQIRMRPTPSPHTETEVFGVSGAAALYRRAALDDARVEGEIFDTCYFSYGEDIDLCWRLRALGWRFVCTPRARAHHVGSGSLGGALRFFDKPVFFQRQALRNRYLTLMKNAAGRDWWQFVPVLILTEMLLWPYLLVRQPLRFAGMVRAPLEFLALLPRALRWRRRLRARRVAPPGYLHRWLSGW